jgi:ferredoxin
MAAADRPVSAIAPEQDVRIKNQEMGGGEFSAGQYCGMPSTAESPLGAPGRFAVLPHCIDCDQCRDAAPTLFDRDPDLHVTYFKRQPVSAHDFALVDEIQSLCPVHAIGDAGAGA